MQGLSSEQDPIPQSVIHFAFGYIVAALLFVSPPFALVSMGFTVEALFAKYLPRPVCVLFTAMVH